MNFLQSLGLIGPYSKLSEDDKRIYRMESRRLRKDEINQQVGERRLKNADKIRAQKRGQYHQNKTKILAKMAEYRGNNKELISDRQRAWRAKNKDALKIRKHEEYLKNRDRYRESHRRWRKENPNWEKEYRKKNEHVFKGKYYQKKRLRLLANPSERAAASMRSRVWALLKKNGQNRICSTGLTKDALRVHLEAQFVVGMTWENYGSEWHVDHHIPCSVFNLSDPEQLKFCFSLQNLRPLWARDNLVKHNKIPDGAVIPFNLKSA